MSAHHASLDGLRGRTGEALKKLAPTMRHATVDAVCEALTKGAKPANKTIAGRLKAAPGALSKTLAARGRREPRGRWWKRHSMWSRRSAEPTTSSITSPRSWWRRIRSTSQKTAASTEETGVGRVNPIITLVSAVVTIVTAVITFGRTKDRLRRLVAGHDSEPHGFVKGVPSAHELLDRALRTDKPDQRTARPRAARRHSPSLHLADRR
jgi:hypothetical protein